MPAPGSSSHPCFQQTVKRYRDIPPPCIAQSYANNSVQGCRRDPHRRNPAYVLGPLRIQPDPNSRQMYVVPSLYTQHSRHITAILPLSLIDCKATANYRHPQHLPQDIETALKSTKVLQTTRTNVHTAPPFTLISEMATHVDARL